MTDINPNEPTPDIPEEKRDESFLDDIINWSADLLSTLKMSDFKKHWAPLFFSGEKNVQEQALEDWEFAVSKGRNKPVYLLNDEGQRVWVFPPINGETASGYTNTPDSFYSKITEATLHGQRLKSAGQRKLENFMSNIEAETVGSKYWAEHLHAIRVECGYPYKGESTIGKPEEKPNHQIKENEDEYDY